MQYNFKIKGGQLKMKTKISILILAVNYLAFSQWGSDIRLTNNPSGSNTSFNNAWCIASSGSVVHAVWSDGRDGNAEIYHKRSVDGGISWGADTRLTNNNAISFQPSVAVSGSIVHLVWMDERDGNLEIYYKRSSDGGVNWGTDTRLTNDPSGSRHPSLAVSGSVVHVVWMDSRDGNWEIYYKRSSDGGISWGADTRLTNNTAFSWYPSVAVSGSVVHTVWEDSRDGNVEIYYKRSSDGGVSWGIDTRLTNNPNLSWRPSVAVSGLFVHVVWEEERDGNWEIYYKRSADGGITWATDTRLTNNIALSRSSSVAALESFVHVVWQDERDGNWEIYYKRSTDAGVNWEIDTRLTNFIGFSEYPSVTTSGSTVHVVWEDTRDGNTEIYYKRNPTGNITSVINLTDFVAGEYKLFQNYPNPFNPSTTIEFEIPEMLNVRLVIYDILGRQVAKLFDEETLPGRYKVEFNADNLNLSGGLYFYRLETQKFSDTKKLLLIK